MLIDDARGTLGSLKASMEEERRVTSRDSLNIGDMVFQRMDRKDGLTLNNGYDDRNKYFVIVGRKSNGEAIGLCLINSDLDYYKGKPELQKYQYLMKKEDYPEFLVKDSRLDCSQLFKMTARKSVAMKAETVGHLTDEDKARILPLVASCEFINNHDKKVYHINEE